MGTRGREVILGMTRDPQFGPMLMFGLGGIFVEVMKDVTFHLAPITAEEAREKGVIEIVANDLGDLLTQADGRAVTTPAGETMPSRPEVGTPAP